MSRSGDARKRAFLRWEFARRNSDYRRAYEKYFPNIQGIIDLSSLNDETYRYFLPRFFIFPLNPRFSFEDILRELKNLKKAKAKLKVCDHPLEDKAIYIRNAIYQLSNIRLLPRFDLEFCNDPH